MAKDILIYGYIGEYLATTFYEKIDAAFDKNENEKLIFRVCTDGGQPQFGWAMLAKIQEVENKKMKVDGSANSMGAFSCLYCDDVEAVDVAEFCIHRAAYPAWYESNPDYFDDFEKKRLNNINANLKKAFKARVDLEKFKEITGKTVDDIFSMDGRAEVVLTAQEAKECNWITSIVKLTPKRKQQIAAYKETIPMEMEGRQVKKAKKPVKASQEEEEQEETIPTKNKEVMTLEKLKAEFPAIYAAILIEGEKNGVKKENDRVNAWLAFATIDAKKVAEGIAKGEDVSMRVIAEFQAVALSPEFLANLKKDSKGAIKTEENKEAEDPNATANTKEIAAFAAGLDAELGLKPKAVAA